MASYAVCLSDDILNAKRHLEHNRRPRRTNRVRADAVPRTSTQARPDSALVVSIASFYEIFWSEAKGERLPFAQ